MGEAAARVRSTAEVFEEHLRLRAAGEVDADLERNYAPDVVPLCEPAVLRGCQAVRESARRLAWQNRARGSVTPPSASRATIYYRVRGTSTVRQAIQEATCNSS